MSSQFCNACLLQGHKAELIVNSVLERCVRCGKDYKNKSETKPQEGSVIKGLNSILRG